MRQVKGDGRGPGTNCPHWPEPCHGHDNAIYGKTFHRAAGPGARPGGFVATGAAKGADEPNGTLHGDQEVEEWACARPWCPVAELDAQSGESKSIGGRIGKKVMGAVAGTPAGRYAKGDPGFGDTGGASRFLYVAKPSRLERELGLDGRSGHPTVKSIDLMRWLCRLVTPPGGLVLDPFMGSGSTGCAAAMEGLRFLGIEQSEEYLEIARKRIEFWEKCAERGMDPREVERGEKAPEAQLGLFGGNR
jgi:hypothetical protein